MDLLLLSMAETGKVTSEPFFWAHWGDSDFMSIAEAYWAQNIEGTDYRSKCVVEGLTEIFFGQRPSAKDISALGIGFGEAGVAEQSTSEEQSSSSEEQKHAVKALSEQSSSTELEQHGNHKMRVIEALGAFFLCRHHPHHADTLFDSMERLMKVHPVPTRN